MKIYNVFHVYDSDSGFGDPIPTSDLIKSFESLEDAQAFVKRFENPHEYQPGYQAEFECGFLDIRESKIVMHTEFCIDNFDPTKYWWTKEYNEMRRLGWISEEYHVYFCDLPYDENGCITERYYCYCSGIQYPAGTPLSEIEKWFEDNYPGGISALTSEVNNNV